MIFLGIDPGLSGALAWVDAQPGKRPRLLGVLDMPTRPEVSSGKTRNIIDLQALADAARNPIFPQPGVVRIEQVGGRPGEAVRAVFRFGYSAGAVAGVAAMICNRIELTPPQVWRRCVGLTGDKGASRALATSFFPDSAPLFKRVKDDGRAEASLIAFSAALDFYR